jgi:hypothetical protein
MAERIASGWFSGLSDGTLAGNLHIEEEMQSICLMVGEELSNLLDGRSDRWCAKGDP